MLSIFKNKNLILASGSPRRKELLEKLNITFEVCVSDIDETMDSSLSLVNELERVALEKAKASKCKTKGIVIGADTVVVCQNEVLGKPTSADVAFEMLRMLSGKTHQVITSYAFYDNEKNTNYSSHVITDVTFFNLSDNDINWYIREEQIFDKAGSYAIQDKGMMLVEKLEGSYTNIVGFPVERILRDLENFISGDIDGII